MTSQDELTLLKQMYERGEIGAGDYDVLRRQVLRGTPLPQLLDDPPRSRSDAPARERPGRGRSGSADRAPSRPGPVRPPSPEFPAAPLGAAHAPRSSDTGARAGRPSPVLPPPASPAPLPPPADPPLSGSRAGLSQPLPLPADPPLSGSRTDLRSPARPPLADPPADPPLSGSRTDLRSPLRPPPADPLPGSRADLGSRPLPPPAGVAGPGSRSRRRSASAAGPGGLATVYGEEPVSRPLPVIREEPGSGPLPRMPKQARGPGGPPAVRDPGQRRPRRRRRGPRLVAALTSLLLSLGLVAAGVWWSTFRQSGVAAPVYARSVCTLVRDWQQAVDTGSTALVRSIARQGDRKAIRASVATYYTDLADRTDALRGSLVAAGVVDLQGGQTYSNSLATVVGHRSTALRELASRAGRLDVGDAAAFQTSLQGLLTGAETAVSDVTSALGRPEAGTPAELRLALGSEPACAPYVG